MKLVLFIGLQEDRRLLGGMSNVTLLIRRALNITDKIVQGVIIERKLLCRASPLLTLILGAIAKRRVFTSVFVFVYSDLIAMSEKTVTAWTSSPGLNTSGNHEPSIVSCAHKCERWVYVCLHVHWACCLYILLSIQLFSEQ